MSYTFVELEVSEETYKEIWELLAIAGYHHVFLDGAIDMKGIALVMKERTQKEKETVTFAKDLAKSVVDQILKQVK